jgi:MerR family transcriptional regulator, light-induced transcriptional regulator
MPTPSESAAQDVRRRLDECIAAHDRPAAVTLALGAVETGEIDIATLYHDVLTPMMNDIGARWQAGATRVWEEHIASTTVRTIVDALYPRVIRMRAQRPPAGHTVVLACPEDEAHDLGLRMISDMFDVSGWTTYLLGADTPTYQIAEAAAATGADHVLLSTTTLVDRVQIRGVLDQLHKRLPDVRVLVVGCEPDCTQRGLRPEEVFHAEEFFSPKSSSGPPADIAEV